MDVTVTRHIADTLVKDQPREDDERDRRSMEGGDQEKSRGRERGQLAEGGRKGREGRRRRRYIHLLRRTDRQTDGLASS